MPSTTRRECTRPRHLRPSSRQPSRTPCGEQPPKARSGREPGDGTDRHALRSGGMSRTALTTARRASPEQAGEARPIRSPSALNPPSNQAARGASRGTPVSPTPWASPGPQGFRLRKRCRLGPRGRLKTVSTTCARSCRARARESGPGRRPARRTGTGGRGFASHSPLHANVPSSVLGPRPSNPPSRLPNIGGQLSHRLHRNTGHTPLTPSPRDDRSRDRTNIPACRTTDPDGKGAGRGKGARPRRWLPEAGGASGGGGGQSSSAGPRTVRAPTGSRSGVPLGHQSS